MLNAKYFREKALFYRVKEYLRLASGPSTKKIAERLLLEIIAFHISFWASRGFFKMKLNLPFTPRQPLEFQIIRKHAAITCKSVERMLRELGYKAFVELDWDSTLYIRVRVSWEK